MPRQRRPGLGAVIVYDDGTRVAVRPRINLIEGTNVTLTIADNTTDEAVDVTIAASGSGGGGTSYGGGTIHLLAARCIANRGDGVANVSSPSSAVSQSIDPRAGVRIYDGACLCLMGVRSATTATNVFGNIYVATR